MKLNVQKRLAASVLKCSPKRVRFQETKLEDIKESITKSDIRGLVGSGIINKLPARGVSRIRARKRLVQRRKGRQQGPGTKKGKHTARLPRKTEWMHRVRKQRSFLVLLKEKNHIEGKIYRELYLKVKGGFFRSRSHLKLYINEHHLVKK